MSVMSVHHDRLWYDVGLLIKPPPHKSGDFTRWRYFSVCSFVCLSPAIRAGGGDLSRRHSLVS